MTATATPPMLRASAATGATAPPPAPTGRSRWLRLVPTLAAALPAAAYVLLSPPSIDLAAHLFRTQLFRSDGFVTWNNYWYAGHDTPAYSVLFPPAAALLSPQLAAALASVATAALFETLVTRLHGRRAWAGAVLFGAATAINLYTGRLALAFGALPALASVVALERRRVALAWPLAALAALCSPVAALFAALAAAGCALGDIAAEQRIRPGLAGALVALAALAPAGGLALAFPEGGSEPFAGETLAPLVVIVIAALILLPRHALRLRAGIAVYGVAAITCFLVSSPVGSNIGRLGTFLAAPLAALLWWRRRPTLLAMAMLPLLYLGWQAPVRDTAMTLGDPSVSAGYYQPLLHFLRKQPGVFRIEIPLTRSHWEAYYIGRSFAIARGWERQLDIRDNHLFYATRLTGASYAKWLHRSAVRFVALPDVALDASAAREAALVRGGLPYLRLVLRPRHWRVYAVTAPAPIAAGAASATAMGPNWLTLRARTPGTTVVRVRYTPYWALARNEGCVSPAGEFTRVTVVRPAIIHLVVRFSLSRIGSRSRRCTSSR